jgi:hypothetical protein
MDSINRVLVVACLVCTSYLPANAFATVISAGLFQSASVGAPSGSFATAEQAFDTTGNLAYVGNSGSVAVASSVLSGYDPFHDETHINDGRYGNGSSWIGNTSNSWLKIDLGVAASIDEIIFGRTRIQTGDQCCDDRVAGSFSIEGALTDDIFGNGNTNNDASEYFSIVGLTAVSYNPLGESVKVDFTAGTPQSVTARFLKLTFLNNGTAIDEVEVFGNSVPAPATLTLIGLGLAGLGYSRRKKA